MTERETRVARLLRTIAEIHPHYWTTSYQRGKLLHGVPSPAPDTLTMHITDACQLRCPFCFAAGSTRRHHLTRDEMRSIIDSFTGLSRMIVLGGEPLSHPDIDWLLDYASTRVSEIEFFTNGLPLVDRSWNIPDRDDCTEGLATITLTFSIDDHHRQQIGESKYREIAELALSLRETDAARVRFNITDPRFFSGGYLNYTALRDLLHDYHPSLRDCFDDSFHARRIDDVFYFNPVICHGGCDDQGEPLDLSSLMSRFELVAGRHRTNGRPVLLNNLTALWMDNPPDNMIVSYLDTSDLFEPILDQYLQRLPDTSAAPVIRDVVRWLSTGNDASCSNALSALSRLDSDPIARTLRYALESRDKLATCEIISLFPQWLLFSGWPQSYDRMIQSAHDTIFRTAITPCKFPIRLTATHSGPHIPWAAVSGVLSDADFASQTRSMLISAARTFHSHFSNAQIPMQDGSHIYLSGLVTAASRYVPLSESTLIDNLTPAHSESPLYLLLPEIISSEGTLSFAIRHLVFVSATDEAALREAYSSLFAMIARLFNESQIEIIRQEFAAIHSPCEMMLPPRLTPTGPPPIVSCNAVTVFQTLFRDPATHAFPYGQQDLAAAVAAIPLTGFFPESVSALRDELDYWAHQSSAVNTNRNEDRTQHV